MAVELATGYVSLVPSGRGLGRGIIRDMRAAGTSAGTEASSAFGSRFVSGMGQIAKRAAQALTIGVGAAGLFGVKLAADFQQTRIAFEGILGDVDKANDLLGDLRDFAARTPFEFTGLAESARQLLAVGFTSDEIIPTMTTLGNVAATLGVGEAEISGVVRALGQMRGKGKASAQELLQISEQVPGFSAINAIAEELGITTAEAFAQMEKGAIPADVAIEAILQGMENFPGAAGAMDRQSKTLNGVLSTLKDTLAGMAIDFITPYLPGLSRAVTSFSGFVKDSAVPALQSFVDFIEEHVVPIFRDHLVPTIQGLVSDGLQAIRDWWDRNGEAITNFFVWFGTVAGNVLGAIGDFIWETLLPRLRDLGAWFIDNKPALAGVFAAIATGFAVWATNALIAAAATILANLPLIILIGLVALLAAGLFWAYTHWGWFKTGVDNAMLSALVFIAVMKGVVGVIKDVLGWVVDLISKLDDLFGKFGRAFTTGGGKDVPDILKNRLASGGPARGGNYLIGEQGPEILSLGSARRGFVHPSGDAFAAALPPPGGIAGGNINVQVTQMPGEDSVTTAVRELRRIQLMSAA